MYTQSWSEVRNASRSIIGVSDWTIDDSVCVSSIIGAMIVTVRYPLFIRPIDVSALDNNRTTWLTNFVIKLGKNKHKAPRQCTTSGWHHSGCIDNERWV